MAACGCRGVIAKLALDSFCSPEVKLTMRSWSIPPTSRIAMGPGLSSKPSTTCFPGYAICLPTASITAPTCGRPLPNLATGQSRSSRAPLGLLAFTFCRADGLSSEPSPGSIETADWQRTSRPQSPARQPGFTSLRHTASHQEIGARIAQPMRFRFGHSAARCHGRCVRPIATAGTRRNVWVSPSTDRQDGWFME
jgi:hypothetical protein